VSVELILGLVFAGFVLLILLETPIFLALAASGGMGIALLRSTDQATAALGNMTYAPLASYSQSIIPMYILLGMFALHGHLSARLFALASSALKWLPGGLGVAAVAACAAFAAVSGSSVATAASIGKISVGEMRRFGYTERFATGIVAAAGTLGILIPPSVALVLYGIVTGESISSLLLAGFVPGVVLAVLFAVYVIGYSLVERRSMQAASQGAVPVLEREPVLVGAAGGGSAREPLAVPEVPQAVSPHDVTPLRQARSALWLAAIMAAVLLGIFSGTFTVTESAAVAALVALVMLLSENARSGPKVLWQRFKSSAIEASGITSMALSLLVGASVVSLFLVLTRTPMRLTDWVVGLDVSAPVVILGIALIMLPLGMFLDGYSLIIIVAPLIHPAVLAVGYDGVWFGIVFVILLEIGLITPPVGMNVFVVASATNISVATVFRGAAPYLAVCLAFVGILVAFPDLALWLPERLAAHQ
jgi:C4-dicarboxylate transporter DctM subunit